MNKGLEALQRLYLTNNTKLPYCKNGECLKDYETIEKELKALEILRRGNFEFGDKYKFRITLNSGIILTKEEFELLKEVLL